MEERSISPSRKGLKLLFDYPGKDLARACFLSFDPNALMRDSLKLE